MTCQLSLSMKRSLEEEEEEGSMLSPKGVKMAGLWCPTRSQRRPPPSSSKTVVYPGELDRSTESPNESLEEYLSLFEEEERRVWPSPILSLHVPLPAMGIGGDLSPSLLICRSHRFLLSSSSLSSLYSLSSSSLSSFPPLSLSWSSLVAALKSASVMGLSVAAPSPSLCLLFLFLFFLVFV